MPFVSVLGLSVYDLRKENSSKLAILGFTFSCFTFICKLYVLWYAQKGQIMNVGRYNPFKTQHDV